MTLNEIRKRCNRPITNVKVNGQKAIIINCKLCNDVMMFMRGNGSGYQWDGDELMLCNNIHDLKGYDLKQYKQGFENSFCLWPKSMNYFNVNATLEIKQPLSSNIKVL